MKLLDVNLEKELLKLRDDSVSTDTQLAIREANKILTEVDEEKREVLSRLKLDKSVQVKSSFDADSNRLKQFDQKRIFTAYEIKQLCCAYGLRFLPIEQYNGDIDLEVPGKVLEFEKKYGPRISRDIMDYKHNNQSYHDRTYFPKYSIVAPVESFTLQDKPKDPLLFAHVGKFHGQDYYHLVHKWGDDLNIGRWLVNLPIRNEVAIFWTHVVLFVIFTRIGFWWGIDGREINGWGVFMIISLIWFFVVCHMFCGAVGIFKNDVYGNGTRWNNGIKSK